MQMYNEFKRSLGVCPGDRYLLTICIYHYTCNELEQVVYFFIYLLYHYSHSLLKHDNEASLHNLFVGNITDVSGTTGKAG